MARLLDDAVVGSPFRTVWSRTGSPTPAMPLDVYGTEDEVVVLAAVPGMRPEDLEVTAHGNTVTLSGTIADAAEGEDTRGATWYLRELWSGRFRRSLTLPFEVDPGQAEATFEHGILRIGLPKAAQAKPSRRNTMGSDRRGVGWRGSSRTGSAQALPGVAKSPACGPAPNCPVDRPPAPTGSPPRGTGAVRTASTRPRRSLAWD